MTDTGQGPGHAGRTRIKVCGIRNREAADAAIDAGADAVGFIFVQKTPRYIRPEDAFAILRDLPPFVHAVGVVRDLSVDAFCDVEESCPCPLMQLHGDEPEHVVRQCGPGVVKAVRVEPDATAAGLRAILEKWDRIEEVDAILVDGPNAGSGQRFDWRLLAEAMGEGDRRIATPVLLAGGLNPDNVAEAVSIVRPYAVDVSSGVERPNADGSPGAKDPVLIRDFCQAVRAAG